MQIFFLATSHFENIFLSAKKDRVDVAPGRLISNQTGKTRKSSFTQRTDGDKLNLKIDDGDIAEKVDVEVNFI
jgi:hypothetical protein